MYEWYIHCVLYTHTLSTFQCVVHLHIHVHVHVYMQSECIRFTYSLYRPKGYILGTQTTSTGGYGRWSMWACQRYMYVRMGHLHVYMYVVVDIAS